MFYRIANLINKEIIQVTRDWLLVAVLILGPVGQLFLLAGNTGKGVKNLATGVCDLDHSRASRALAQALDNTEELRVTRYAADLAQLTQWLEAGGVDVAVIIPVNFERDLQSRTPPPQVQVLASGTNTITGGVGLAVAQRVVSDYGLAQLAAGAGAAPIDFRTSISFNPTLNSRNYTIPAMIGLIVLELTLIVSSLGLTRERETGTLEQLIIMPFRRLELMIGKAVPPLVVTLADFGVMLVMAVHLFHVPLQGSLALLVGLTALFMVVEVNWGLLISTFARTQQQAVLFVFVQAMFDMTFSGFLVPVENLPAGLQWVAYAVPLRHYLIIIRTLMLKGATLTTLWPEALALVLLGLGLGGLALLNLGQRLD